MGIHCEVNICKPADGAFRPGSLINGAIKYAVDEETSFKHITVSLKGRGNLHVRQTQGKTETNYYKKEKYVDFNHVIAGQEKELTVSIGSYETSFSFVLPTNVPPCLKYKQHVSGCEVYCKILYYIRIEFVRPGFFQLNKCFKKELNVVAGITPILPVGECILGGKKTLTQFFKRDKSVVEITATIQSCVIQPGGKININYELVNDTDVTVSNIKWKLVEVYKFFVTNSQKERESPKIVTHKAIEGTDAKTGSVTSRNKQSMDIEISVPGDISGSIDNSTMVAREYEVRLVVGLPMPHRDLKLPIPVQIGDLVQEITELAMPVHGMEPPPSYWEAMAEDDEKSDDDEKK